MWNIFPISLRRNALYIWLKSTFCSKTFYELGQENLIKLKAARAILDSDSAWQLISLYPLAYQFQNLK